MSDSQIPNLPLAIAISGQEQLELVQAGISVRAYVNMLGGSTEYFPFLPSGPTHDQGLVPDPGATAGNAKFLCEDATWSIPYTAFVQSGPAHAEGLVPDPGAASGNSRFLNEDSTWKTPPVFLASGASHKIGYVPDPGATSGTSKFLNESAIWTRLPFQETISCAAVNGDMTVGSGKEIFRIPCAVLLSSVTASLTTAATGVSLFTVDVKKNGVSIFSTLLTFNSGSKTTVGATTPAVLTSNPLAIAYDDEISIDVTTIGPVIGGKGLKVTFLGVQS